MDNKKRSFYRSFFYGNAFKIIAKALAYLASN
jgi:hypothetical protein